MENWKSLVGYEGLYEVSDRGRVRSIVQRGRWKPGVLKPRNIHGYLQVHLYKDGHGKRFTVHRLVAQAFIPNPQNLPEVNHIDENKENNAKENLEWISHQGNIDYSQSKAVQQIDPSTGEVIAMFISGQGAERQTGISQGSISRVCNGKRKSAAGYFWRYAQ